MSKAAQSVFIFAVYLFLLGVTLVVVPNLLLGLNGRPSTTSTPFIATLPGGGGPEE